MRATDLRSRLALTCITTCLLGAMASAAERVEQAKQPEPAAAPADLKFASAANGRFAVDLYRQLAETESGKSLFLSPFSMSLALTMVAEGAVDETLDQMIDVLHLDKGKLARMHSGQGGLQRSAIPVVPPELTKKIASLRAKLNEANVRTSALEKSNRYSEASDSSDVAHKLAHEINTIVSQTAAYELQIANAVWVEKSYPIQPSFISTLTPHYGTSVFPMDFKAQPDPARLQINQWVASHTHDRIQNLLAPQSITSLTKLVITNAVYFRGDWADPFETSRTRPQPFYMANNRSSDMPMMRQWNEAFASYGAFKFDGEPFPTPREIPIDLKDDDPSLYPGSKGYTMLSLDYQGRRIQMILLVPQSATGLAALERLLTYEKLQHWIGQLQHRTIDVTLPKYKLEATYELRKALETLGMARAFAEPRSGGEGAQFDKLSSSKRADDSLYISQVVHKTIVEVSEVGTEAAAATAVELDVKSEALPERPKTRPFTPIFRADKPFLFLIRDRETANILFLGRYVGLLNG